MTEKITPENAKRLADRFGNTIFPITGVSRDDIENFMVQEDRMDLALMSRQLTDTQMEAIASRMADDYCTQLYWTQVEILPMDMLNELLQKPENQCEHGKVPAMCPDCSVCGKCKKRTWCDYSTYDPKEPTEGPLENPYPETECCDLDEGEPMTEEEYEKEQEPDRESEYQEKLAERQRKQRRDQDSHRAANKSEGW
jgi:hypothetical protein